MTGSGPVRDKSVRDPFQSSTSGCFRVVQFECRLNSSHSEKSPPSMCTREPFLSNFSKSRAGARSLIRDGPTDFVVFWTRCGSAVSYGPTNLVIFGARCGSAVSYGPTDFVVFWTRCGSAIRHCKTRFIVFGACTGSLICNRPADPRITEVGGLCCGPIPRKHQHKECNDFHVPPQISSSSMLSL